MAEEQREKFDVFMGLFNELEGLIRKIYVPQDGKSIMLMYINDIPEPYSSKMNTIRCARNVYVHGAKFNEEPLIQINDAVISFLKERIADVKERIAKLGQEKHLEEERTEGEGTENYEYRERSLSAGDSINKIKELYSWYGWEYVGCEGLDDLDCKPTMKFRRDTTAKGYKALSTLWNQRLEKQDECDRVRKKNNSDSNKSSNSFVKAIKIIITAIIVFALFVGCMFLIVYLINIVDGIWGFILVPTLSMIIMLGSVFGIIKLIFHEKRAKNKKGETSYKSEFEIANEITDLDTQAKNICEYLK